MTNLVFLAFTQGCTYHPPPESANDLLPVDGKAHKLETDHYLQYGVATNISATPEQIWPILTDAPGFPSWNSTVVSIGGTIAKDEKIVLKAKIDEKREFELNVSEFEPPTRMVWSEGSENFMGVRTFVLTGKDDGSTDFSMKEGFTGRFLGMIKGQLPDFGPDFETFAADLKKEAEKRNPPPPSPPAEPAAEGEPPPPG
jgi:hypothetical protein